MRYRELVARYGSAEQAFDTVPSRASRARALVEADNLLARTAECGAGILQSGDADYPAALAELHDPPPWLCHRGDLELLSSTSAAIVGTRHATAYGERIARELAGSLSRAGATVVSGLARGIDAAVHRATLDADGRTIAVLGTGVDVSYPVAHRVMQAEIAERGLLLSEEAPGSRATTAAFPKRNRIIAAITRATFIVEAPLKSGALITADHATDLNRIVAAVPGPVDSMQSAGTNLLLRDGAHVIASVDDALALMGFSPSPLFAPDLRTPDERRVWAALARCPLDLDTLAALASLPARNCMTAVANLELRGVVETDFAGVVRRGKGGVSREQ